uniref:Uncharacterized protein n=1 Tax=Arundo donax TaxID=35708 RepID=A0A0A9FKM7_ARUDO
MSLNQISMQFSIGMSKVAKIMILRMASV